jgi:hypothetical protein
MLIFIEEGPTHLVWWVSDKGMTLLQWFVWSKLEQFVSGAKGWSILTASVSDIL